MAARPLEARHPLAMGVSGRGAMWIIMPHAIWRCLCAGRRRRRKACTRWNGWHIRHSRAYPAAQAPREGDTGGGRTSVRVTAACESRRLAAMAPSTSVIWSTAFASSVNTPMSPLPADVVAMTAVEPIITPGVSGHATATHPGLGVSIAIVADVSAHTFRRAGERARHGRAQPSRRCIGGMHAT